MLFIVGPPLSLTGVLRNLFGDPQMRTAVRVLIVAVVLLLVAGGTFYLWASVSADRILARTYEVHMMDFPIPFPLTEEESEAWEISPDEAERLAQDRARDRGRHLVEARYACSECHGADFSGGVMVDAFPIGRLLGPNLTGGEGGRTAGYTAADWDRIVRHGLLPDGRPATMPSEDFQLMSDQELSDIIVYLESQPPVDNVVPPVKLGPLGKVLLATGQLHLSVDLIEEHDVAHATLPPPTEVSLEFGRHLVGVCTGCHGQDLTGGPIAGGDPSWLPAANLTPHEDGLAGWSYEDFVRAMREARRPDGSEIGLPMTLVAPYAERMTEVELQAMWIYLQSLPPTRAAAG